ncbi:hypothetical protein GQ44DRAFT_719667 [Phaeosphaeriaceae sp. PMI808]|nr:hypothetical protein GQ44DRAFT_719667 [Phaeosphaeriaceae sp. PMI808]
MTGVGQSAGAMHMQTLIDIFPDVLDRAIILSYPVGVVVNSEMRQLVRNTVKENLPSGVTMESATTEQLLSVQGKTAQILVGTIAPFWPNIDPRMYQPSKDRKEIIICWTKDDGNAFARLEGKDIKVDGPEKTKFMFRDPALQIGKRFREQGHDVAFYEITWAPQEFDLGHSAPMIGKTPWEEWEKQGEQVRKRFGDFARCGTKLEGINIFESRDNFSG